MRGRWVLVAGATALLVAAGVAWRGGQGERPEPAWPELSVTEGLGGDASGYARALAPRAFEFPRDHGPHDGFRTEWWYLTGQLRGVSGERFGFQVTIFRIALSPTITVRRSAWGARHVLLGHLAVTDVERGRFAFAERWSREALGLAGATVRPLRVWLDDWTLQGSATGGPPLRVRARAEGIGVDLVVAEGKPPVLHGEGGLSRKSAGVGNASYYYSLTRMPARGSVWLGPRRQEVEGAAWLDREWSTSALAPDQAGWDWFALQLDDGRDLMLYRLRRRDGSLDPASAGTVVDVRGRAEGLPAGAAIVETLGWWESPRGDARYPARWRIGMPARGLDLEVWPLVADQELAASVRYWEGAVAVRGLADGRPVTGQGYVELTGYATGVPGKRGGR